MQKTDNIMQCNLLFPLLVLLLFASDVQAEGLQARYLENSGKRSVLEIRVENPSPSSVIIKQQLPAGQKITRTQPQYKKYNAKKGVVTWLFKRPVPGVLKVVTQYTTALGGKGATAVIHCKSPRNGSLVTIHVQ